MKEPRAYYQRLRDEQLAIHQELRQRYDRFALLRLIIFVLLLGGVVFAGNFNFFAGLGAFLLFVGIAYYLVRYHDDIRRDAELAEVRAKIADRELGASNHDFRVFDGGEEFADPSHPYASDLDIFGRHSLFQLINRTVTAPGKQMLADALLKPQKAEVRARTQEQSKDLEKQPDWCTTWRALGEGITDSREQQRRLKEWVQRPQVVQGGLDKAMITVAPLLTIAFLVTAFVLDPWYLSLLFLLPAILIHRKYGDIIAEEHAYTAATGKLLAQYADLLSHLESWELGKTGSTGAVPALRQLSYAISQLDVRYNPFSIVVEIGGLWSLRWLAKLDHWRTTHHDDLPNWLAAVARADAMVSWATLRFNHPDWTDPEFTKEPVLEASQLAHPLLNPNGRVANDLKLGTNGHIQLVTGSNMAGKSTWLRTVGINLVLAQAGSPVCALHLRQRPLQVWTSMRTHDDLSESTSSFYAELKRLQAIITAVSRGEHVFFLLDEILKGTNSRDRHTGSRALIRQLIRDRGAGIIATHDLELADLENEPGSRVENYAMEVQTQGDELIFDYKLHPGVCTSFNATALMARMGIDIPADEIKLHHD